MRLFLLLSLISFNVFAIDWNDLEDGSNYKLIQGFSLPQLERSGSILEVMPGDQVVLAETVPLDMINVVLYIFDYKNCPGPQMLTDMEIIPVNGTSPVVEIGAQLEKNCKLHVYIETRDLMSNSFFE